MVEATSPVVAERIRRVAPENSSVLPGSLPVVAFGNLFDASVATLALNPSSREFLSASKQWLRGPKRRLASLVSMGVEDPRDLDDTMVAQVVAESDSYFQGPNWYRAWFGWLESLMTTAGAGSYLNGSACHLDLVQWATDPVQRDVPPAAWRRLVDSDRDFLRWQLQRDTLATVLVNGRACVDQLRTAGIVHSWSEDQITITNRRGPDVIRVFRADELSVRFIGWNRPLAGALPADGRARLAEWVRSSLAG